MPQQAYCQPREYQCAPPVPQGSTMYPGPSPPWDAPYEPAGDVSCLWVLPSSWFGSWFPSSSFYLLFSPWGLFLTLNCYFIHIIIYYGLSVNYISFRNSLYSLLFKFKSSLSFELSGRRHHQTFYWVCHIMFYCQTKWILIYPVLYSIPSIQSSTRGCVAVDLVSHRYYKHVNSLSQR